MVYLSSTELVRVQQKKNKRKDYISNFMENRFLAEHSWSCLQCPEAGFLTYSDEQVFALLNYCRFYRGWEGLFLLPYLIVLSFLKYILCSPRNSHILWFVTVNSAFFFFFGFVISSLKLNIVQVPLSLLPWNNWTVGSRKLIQQSYVTSTFCKTYLSSVKVSGN